MSYLFIGELVTQVCTYVGTSVLFASSIGIVVSIIGTIVSLWTILRPWMHAGDAATISMDNNVKQLVIVRNQGRLLQTGAISSEQFHEAVSDPLKKIVVTTIFNGEIVENYVDATARNQMLEATDTLCKIVPEILPPNGKIDMMKDRARIEIAYRLSKTLTQFYGALLSLPQVDVIEQNNMVTK